MMEIRILGPYQDSRREHGLNAVPRDYWHLAWAWHPSHGHVQYSAVLEDEQTDRLDAFCCT